MTIHTIAVEGGRGKTGDREPVARLELHMGDVVSIVGPTGSGKTTLIHDVEQFADGTTPTERRVLIDGEPAPPEWRDDPSRNPIALITQHTTFLSDMPVRGFLATHGRIRQSDPGSVDALVDRTLDFADELSGEAVDRSGRMTDLSGGQTRALLIADAAVIAAAPVVLLDEIENAGIDRMRAVELLRQERKIYVFVTHDPSIALLADYRVVMGEGQMRSVLRADDSERTVSERLARLDGTLGRLRERLRRGERVGADALEGVA